MGSITSDEGLSSLNDDDDDILVVLCTLCTKAGTCSAGVSPHTNSPEGGRPACLILFHRKFQELAGTEGLSFLLDRIKGLKIVQFYSPSLGLEIFGP